ncbi:hypothetical protein FG05_35168 [Fusarium graminearum]|nr:hypothetical protein FG05_35168 [Fusarium graminearum]
MSSSFCQLGDLNANIMDPVRACSIKLPVFNGPSRSLAGYNQVLGGKRKLPLLQLSSWDSDFEDDETDPTCIHYDIEWKLKLKKGRVSKLAEITEKDLTLAPSAYWDRFLSAELDKMVASKVPSPEHEPVETIVVVSVDKRSERNLRKQFPGLSIQWKAVEDKIQSWSPLFCEGHKLSLQILEGGRAIEGPQAGNSLPETDSSPSRKILLAVVRCGTMSTKSSIVQVFRVSTQAFIAGAIQSD